MAVRLELTSLRGAPNFAGATGRGGLLGKGQGPRLLARRYFQAGQYAHKCLALPRRDAVTGHSPNTANRLSCLHCSLLQASVSRFSIGVLRIIVMQVAI